MKEKDHWRGQCYKRAKLLLRTLGNKCELKVMLFNIWAPPTLLRTLCSKEAIEMKMELEDAVSWWLTFFRWVGFTPRWIYVRFFPFLHFLSSLLLDGYLAFSITGRFLRRFVFDSSGTLNKVSKNLNKQSSVRLSQMRIGLDSQPAKENWCVYRGSRET